MADKERERTYDEKVLKRKEIDQALKDLSPDDKDQVLSKFSRRTFLIRSGQFGAAAVVGAATAAVVGGFKLGELTGAQGERGRIFPKGVLTPELRDIFRDKRIFVYEPKGKTVASIRAYLSSIGAVGLDIPSSPLAIPEGKPDPDTVASQLGWLAVDQNNSYIVGKGNESVSALGGLVTTETTNVQTLLGRKDIQIVSSSLRPIDIIGLEHAYRLENEGKSLFSQVIQEGVFVIIPGAKVGNSGVALGLSEAGFRWSVYDASTQNPTPPTDRLVAARVIGAK